jgi:predicted lipoprotein
VRRLTGLLAVGLVAVACTGREASQADVVASMTDQGLVPAIESAVDSLAGLAGEVAELCEAPTEEGLTEARDAWLEARSAWRRAEIAAYFGPAEMLRTVSFVDYWPVSPEGIDELVTGDVSIDADYVANRAASTQRGLGTVEHFLFADRLPDPRDFDL